MRRDRFNLDDMAREMPGHAPHRAYVGQPQRYDVMGASQFALLFLLGLREHHRLLDFGCGSLRLGRLAIPYLAADRYFGIEPVPELVELGFSEELGQDLRTLKRPRFDSNRDYRIDVFGERFDFIIAQSVFSHTGDAVTRRGLAAFARGLAPGGLVVLNVLLGEPAPEADAIEWAYPACVPYHPDQVIDMAAKAGLAARACPWPHPGLSWFLMAHDEDDLPTTAMLGALRVSPPAWD